MPISFAVDLELCSLARLIVRDLRRLDSSVRGTHHMLIERKSVAGLFADEKGPSNLSDVPDTVSNVIQTV